MFNFRRRPRSPSGLPPTSAEGNERMQRILDKLMEVYFDKNGTPIDRNQWSEYLGDKNYQVIAQDTIGKYFISTVWIGIGFGMKPLIFETMIFCDDKEDEFCGWQERYETIYQAYEGHHTALDMCIRKYPQSDVYLGPEFKYQEEENDLDLQLGELDPSE